MHEANSRRSQWEDLLDFKINKKKPDRLTARDACDPTPRWPYCELCTDVWPSFFEAEAVCPHHTRQWQAILKPQE